MLFWKRKTHAQICPVSKQTNNKKIVNTKKKDLIVLFEEFLDFFLEDMEKIINSNIYIFLNVLYW